MNAQPDPQAWGISAGYHRSDGTWVSAAPAGVRAALEAMGADAPAPPPTRTWVVRSGETVAIPGTATLVTEDGGEERISGVLPPVPLGYHRLEFDHGDIELIVSPGRCPIPSRGWGWSVQLYALRSASSWGVGDLADLGAVAAWAGRQGARFVFTNPLHAVAPTSPQQASPYFPTSRRFRNPIYLRVENVPGSEALPVPELDVLAASGRRANGDDRIDRDRVWTVKRTALERIWQATGAAGASRPELDRWSTDAGPGLRQFATFAALAEIHGGDWRGWPRGMHRPDGDAALRFARGPGADRVRFHAWLQWLTDCQLRAAAAQAAGSGVGLVGDLAVGADPGGADAWEWQDLLAAGISVGAPPDSFSPEGQDWGFPPWDPWRLRRAGYRPFIDVLRAALCGCAGVRIDHVMGLFRLFWLASGRSAADGVYVSYPWEDLCRIVALESHRATAFVVGEDLGTVEPGVRSALMDLGGLSTRLLLFEDDLPDRWPELALATVTTHDLPTVAGIVTGADARVRAQIGMAVDRLTEAGMQRRLEAVAGAPRMQMAASGDREAVASVVQSLYAPLAASPCRVVAASLEDALGVETRPNMPGAPQHWPNWSRALPVAREEIEASPRVAALARTIDRARSKGAATPADG